MTDLYHPPPCMSPGGSGKPCESQRPLTRTPVCTSWSLKPRMGYTTGASSSISLSFARLGQELALPEIPPGVSEILIGSIHTIKPLILQSRQSANGLYAILSLISPTWIYLWWPQVPPEVS